MRNLILGIIGAIVVLPSVAIASTPPGQQLDAIYIGQTGDGVGNAIVKAGDRSTSVIYRRYGEDGLKGYRQAYFDCDKGIVTKIHKIYDDEWIRVDQPPASTPFKIMMMVACVQKELI